MAFKYSLEGFHPTADVRPWTSEDLKNDSALLDRFVELWWQLDEAEDNNTIYIANGVYSGLDNTKITIEKSLNIVGSDNTTFDGLYENYIFLINDGISEMGYFG